MLNELSKGHTEVSFRSEEFLKLSAWIAEIQNLAREQFQLGKLWIGGGSSRTILDHLYFHKSLSMRDLDIFFVGNGRIAQSTVVEFAETLEERNIASMGNHSSIRTKTRSNPKLEGTQKFDYKAGFGMHLFRKDMPILSVSFFHSYDDLMLNGILNIDKILLPLAADETLLDYSQRVTDFVPYTSLASLGHLIDPYNGYVAWVRRNPEIVNWLCLQADSPMKSIRILRSYAKCGCEALPDDVAERMKGFVAVSGSPVDSFEMMRTFVKIMSEPNVAPQLSMLASIGTLKFVSEKLQSSLEGQSAVEIKARLRKSGGGLRKRSAEKPEALERLELLTRQMDQAARHELLERARAAYPTTFA